MKANSLRGRASRYGSSPAGTSGAAVLCISFIVFALAASGARTASAQRAELQRVAAEGRALLKSSAALPAHVQAPIEWVIPDHYAQQQGPASILLADFEQSGWPRSSDLSPECGWLPDSLFDLDPRAGEFHWAVRDCEAVSGSQSLCAVCGGAEGSAQACGDPYPDQVLGSVELILDLSAFVAPMKQLDLVLDVWAEAEPTEGLFVNVLDVRPDGSIEARHTIRSYTGDLAAWALDQRIDLLDVVDEDDASWRRNLAGQRVVIELLFLSLDNGNNGAGLHIDNLELEHEIETIVITNTPTPTSTASPTPLPSPTSASSPTPVPSVTPTQSTGPVDRTVYCPPGSTCARLRVEAFLDLRCDGRFNWGVDSWSGGSRIDIDVSGTQLGTETSRRGSAYFLLPQQDGIQVSFTPPAGYKLCGNSSNPQMLGSRDFRFGNKQINFRIVRDRSLSLASDYEEASSPSSIFR